MCVKEILIQYIFKHHKQGGTCQGGGTRGHVLVTELRGMALNDLFVLMCYGHSILSPLTDFTYKYHPEHKHKRKQSW